MDVARARIIFLTVVCTVGLIILVENVSPGFLRQVRLYQVDEYAVAADLEDASESRVSTVHNGTLAVSEPKNEPSQAPSIFPEQGSFINVSSDQENDVFYDFPVTSEMTTAAVRTIERPTAVENKKSPAEIELKKAPKPPAPHVQWNFSSEAPVILFWTKFYTDNFVPELTLYKEAVRDLKKCPYSNCKLTNDRNILSKSSALIFHVTDLRDNDLPAARSADQYYIYYGIESPVHLFYDLKSMKSYFNLTMTFRLDSDVITHSYFQHFDPKVWTEPDEFEKLWSQKSKFAAIFVSNCNPSSGRDVYLSELKQYVEVDVYGRCGRMQCSTQTPGDCDKLVTQYKFYLAFENSVCRDYVTEKIHRALNYGAVPIVYGGANYTAIFPPRSFISVLDYESPEHLAEYLKFLDQNPEQYSKYFDWRRSSSTAVLPKKIQPDNLGFCKICSILNTRQPAHHEVKDLDGWWNGGGWCVPPQLRDQDGKTKWAKNPVMPFSESLSFIRLLDVSGITATSTSSWKSAENPKYYGEPTSFDCAKTHPLEVAVNIINVYSARKAKTLPSSKQTVAKRSTTTKGARLRCGDPYSIINTGVAKIHSGRPFCIEKYVQKVRSVDIFIGILSYAISFHTLNASFYVSR